jgi:hypothetical protein
MKCVRNGGRCIWGTLKAMGKLEYEFDDKTNFMISSKDYLPLFVNSNEKYPTITYSLSVTLNTEVNDNTQSLKRLATMSSQGVRPYWRGIHQSKKDNQTFYIVA